MTKQEIMKVIAADRTLKQIDYLGAREPISATDLLKCIKHMCKQLDRAQQTIYVLSASVPMEGYE